EMTKLSGTVRGGEKGPHRTSDRGCRCSSGAGTAPDGPGHSRRRQRPPTSTSRRRGVLCRFRDGLSRRQTERRSGKGIHGPEGAAEESPGRSPGTTAARTEIQARPEGATQGLGLGELVSPLQGEIFFVLTSFDPGALPRAIMSCPFG